MEYISSLITGAVETFGFAGVMVFLFVVGRIHGDGEVEYLKEALDTERKAHDVTKHALEIETQRSQLAYLNSEILQRAFRKGDDD